MAVKDVNIRYKSTGAAKVSRETKALDTNFKKTAQAAVAFGAALVLIRGIKIASEFLQQQAAMQSTRTSLDKLTGSYKNAQKFVDATTIALKGSVSQLDAAAFAVKALSLGVIDNADQMGELAEIAVTLGRAMGLDVNQSLNDFITGVGRQSVLVLDNLGISASKVTEKIKELQAGNENMTRQQAFTTAALEIGRAKFEELGGVVDDNALKFAQIEAKVQNLKDEFASGLTPAVTNILDNLIFLLEKINLSTFNFTKFALKVGASAAASIFLAKTLVDVIKFILISNASTIAAIKSQKVWIIAMSKAARAIFVIVRNINPWIRGITLIVAGLILANKALTKFRTRTKEAQFAVEDFIAASKLEGLEFALAQNNLALKQLQKQFKEASGKEAKALVTRILKIHKSIEFLNAEIDILNKKKIAAQKPEETKDEPAELELSELRKVSIKERFNTKLIELSQGQFELQRAILEQDLEEFRKADIEKTAIAKFSALSRKKIDAAEVSFKLSTISSLFAASSKLTTASKGNALVAARLAQTGAIIDTFAAANKALASGPPPFNFIAAAAVTLAGIANVVAIEQELSSIKSAAIGTDFITSGPELLLVGDNPGGKERITAAPISSRNVNGPTSSPTIIFNNPILARSFVEDDIIPMIRDAIRRGV